MTKLKIPALIEIEIDKSIEDKSCESKNKFKQEFDEAVNHSIRVLDLIKQEDFSKYPDFLELQIKQVKQKLNDVFKDLFAKLELTDYEDPEDNYSMIKTANAVFS